MLNNYEYGASALMLLLFVSTVERQVERQHKLNCINRVHIALFSVY